MLEIQTVENLALCLQRLGKADPRLTTDFKGLDEK